MRTGSETCNKNSNAHDIDLEESPRRPVESMTQNELRDLAVELVNKIMDGYDKRGYDQPWRLGDDWLESAGNALRDDHGIESLDEDGNSTEEFDAMVGLVEGEMQDKWITTSIERLTSLPEAMANRIDDDQIQSELIEFWDIGFDLEDMWDVIASAAATVAEKKKKA